MKHFWKLLLPALWIAFVMGSYYAGHSRYFKYWEVYDRPVIFLILTVLLTFPAIFYLLRLNKRVAIWKLFLLGLACLFVVYNSISYFHDISVFRSGYETGVLTKKVNEYQFHKDASELSDGEEVIFKEGDIVEYTDIQTKGFPVEAGKFFFREGFFGRNVNFIGILWAPIFLLIVVFFVTLVFGSLILGKVFGFEKDRAELLEYMVLAQGLGFLALAFLLFLIGAFGMLNFIGVCGLFIAMVALSYREIPFFWQLISRPFKGLNFISVGTFLLFFLQILIAFNLIDIVRPTPVSWDEITEYINVPHLIAENANLVPRPAYYYGLIMSLGFVLFDSVAAAGFMAFLGGISGVISLYLITRRFLSGTISLLLAVLFYSLPFFYWQSGIDIKIDPALFFFTNLGMLWFLIWREKNPEVFQSKSFSWQYVKPLALCALMLGFSLGIKYTAILAFFTIFILLSGILMGYVGGALAFIISLLGLALSGFSGNNLAIFSVGKAGFYLLLVSLFGLLVILVKKKKEFFWRKVILVGLFVVFFLLPVTPWLIKNYAYKPEFSANNLFFSEYEPKISFVEAGVDQSLCGNLGGNEEIDRYMGGKSVAATFWRLPWDLTMNTYLNKEYVDMSFFFLALIPGLLIFFPKNKFVYGLSGATAIYFLFWAFTSQGIIWYGLAGFLGLLTIMGILIQNSVKESRIFGYGFGLVFALWFFGMFPVRYATVANDRILAYSSGYIAADDFAERFFGGTREIQKILNSESNKDVKILRIGTFTRYWIADNHRRVINDDSMFALNCLYIEKDYKLTVERLKRLGVKYIIFDKFADTVEGVTGEKIKERMAYAQSFLSHLNIVFDTGRFSLYEVK